MRENKASMHGHTQGFLHDLRTSLKHAIQTESSIKRFAEEHDFDAGDLNRFLNGRKDWTLSKVVLLLSCLNTNVHLHNQDFSFDHDFRQQKLDETVALLGF